jgi:hypothetical protein
MWDFGRSPLHPSSLSRHPYDLLVVVRVTSE